ncbi:MAG: FHA domain-containing protein [Prevotella sp.]|nr:FHA domain-containing protein [Prevotella sp.]MBR1462446.1 FHA domain-containing protein [Prevotella sp.]
MLEELQIRCPSCSAILSIRNSRHEETKHIECPNCHKHLAVDFRESTKPTLEKTPYKLAYGEAEYQLREGKNTIGCKSPSSKADIQIATGDPLLTFEHAIINVFLLKDGSYKHVISSLTEKHPAYINGELLHNGDEVVLCKGDEIDLGESVLLVK